MLATFALCHGGSPFLLEQARTRRADGAALPGNAPLGAPRRGLHLAAVRIGIANLGSLASGRFAVL